MDNAAVKAAILRLEALASDAQRRAQRAGAAEALLATGKTRLAKQDRQLLVRVHASLTMATERVEAAASAGAAGPAVRRAAAAAAGQIKNHLDTDVRFSKKARQRQQAREREESRRKDTFKAKAVHAQARMKKRVKRGKKRRRGADADKNNPGQQELHRRQLRVLKRRDLRTKDGRRCQVNPRVRERIMRDMGARGPHGGRGRRDGPKHGRVEDDNYDNYGT